MLLKYIYRAMVLFTVGATLSLVFRINQVQRFNQNRLEIQQRLQRDRDGVDHLFNFTSMDLVFESTTWRWLPTVCGIAAVFVGLLYPRVDRKFLQFNTNVLSNDDNMEWASVMRCTAIFVGINQVCARIEFPSQLHLTLTLTLMCAILWWTFDRTPNGFTLGLLSALVALLVVHFMFEKEGTHIRSWLPYVFFSGGITVGNIGRQLATENQFETKLKEN